MVPAQNNATSNRWAVRVGVALVAGLAVVAIFTTTDRLYRGELERVDEPTAVGDKNFVKPPSNANTPAAIFHGQPLVAVQSVEGRDSQMRKAGRDDADQFFIYEKAQAKEPGTFFLKTAAGQYLRVVAH